MVAGTPNGLTGFAPPSDGVCLRHSATSCSPTRSALEALISRASGTARSANFVACSSFQIVPEPSIADEIVVALIAGDRSAPRKTLRVITVMVGGFWAWAVGGEDERQRERESQGGFHTPECSR